MNYLLLDTSYIIFYRYFALLQWWKLAKKDIALPENPSECPEFVEKFTKLFLEQINTIKKKLKIHKEECKVIAARDCPRKEIWRNELFPQYKESRYKDDAFMGGEFFKLVYANDFLEKAGVEYIFKYNKLEADDIVAITKNYIRKKYPEATIYIITNDQDYLQLSDENTKLFNLQFKNLLDNKKVFPEADKNLFYKIVLGDKSDCIPPILSGCGPKTTEKYYENKELFLKALEKTEGAKERYELNKKLVSFSEIPCELLENFIQTFHVEFSNL
jgi:5'-3' exonuclease